MTPKDAASEWADMSTEAIREGIGLLVMAKIKAIEEERDDVIRELTEVIAELKAELAARGEDGA